MLGLLQTVLGAAAFAAFSFTLALLVLNLLVRPGSGLTPGEVWWFLTHDSKSGLPPWLKIPDSFRHQAELLRGEAGVAMTIEPSALAQRWYHNAAQLALVLVAVVTVVPAILGLVLAPHSAAIVAALMAVAVFLAGASTYYSDRAKLRRAGAHRQQALVGDLAFALDGVVMMLDAGAAFDQALEAYVTMTGAGRPVPLPRASSQKGLADSSVYSRLAPLQAEFWIVLQEIRSGEGKERAFQNLAARCACMEVDRLVVSIRQSERMGTPLSQTLLAQAGLLRTERSQRATTLAEQISKEAGMWVTFMALIGMSLLIMPAVLTMGSAGHAIFGAK